MTAETKKGRGPVTKYDIVDRAVVIREKDKEPIMVNVLDSSSTATLERLAAEGFIAEHRRGAAWDTIVAGKSFVDRSPPAEKPAKADKPPSQAVQIIATAYGTELIKDESNGAVKPARVRQEELRSLAMAWAKELDAAGRATANKAILAHVVDASVRIGPALAKPAEQEAA